MASTEGFEPATARLEGVCSIQLSYVDNFNGIYDIISPVNVNNKLQFFNFSISNLTVIESDYSVGTLAASSWP